MAFQNNSGDIILDVVLTDEGRRRLAMGGSQFEITKFALGDDEINYALFDTGSTTALQDLSILQTPLLEAFTNNTSLMKSKLLSLDGAADILYLPVLKINDLQTKSKMTDLNNFVVCVDARTFVDSQTDDDEAIAVSKDGERAGFLKGTTSGASDGGTEIIIDSGIDTTDVVNMLDQIENSFMIEIDNRLGQIIDVNGKQISAESIDDDNIAVYVVSSETNDTFVSTNVQTEGSEALDSTINGPVGARLKFKIKSSEQLRTSNFLFDRIGKRDSTAYSDKNGDPQEVRMIDSIVRVSGMTLGYSIDIPVRFAKSV